MRSQVVIGLTLLFQNWSSVPGGAPGGAAGEFSIVPPVSGDENPPQYPVMSVHAFERAHVKKASRELMWDVTTELETDYGESVAIYQKLKSLTKRVQSVLGKYEYHLKNQAAMSYVSKNKARSSFLELFDEPNFPPTPEINVVIDDVPMREFINENGRRTMVANQILHDQLNAYTKVVNGTTDLYNSLKDMTSRVTQLSYGPDLIMAKGKVNAGSAGGQTQTTGSVSGSPNSGGTSYIELGVEGLGHGPDLTRSFQLDTVPPFTEIHIGEEAPLEDEEYGSLLTRVDGLGIVDTNSTMDMLIGMTLKQVIPVELRLMESMTKSAQKSASKAQQDEIKKEQREAQNKARVSAG